MYSYFLFHSSYMPNILNLLNISNLSTLNDIYKSFIIIIIIIIIGWAVLSPYVSVQVPRYLLVPGTATILAYCTNPNDRWWWFLEQLVEWKLAGETEVLGENLPQRYFVHHKTPHDRPGLEPRTAAVGSQRLTA
jgi:hypothetical protein